MKIVSLEEFKKYPKDTLYAEYNYPDILNVKDSELFGAISLAEVNVVNDDDFLADYNKDELFIIYNSNDIDEIIKLLIKSKEVVDGTY